MSPTGEKRLLQAVVALACLVPLSAGGAGVIQSAAMLKGVSAPVPPDLDSHYRYLSGLLLGIGFVFASSIFAIERRTLVFRTLGVVVVVGGLGRLFAVVEGGEPSTGHLLALAMELLAVPLIVLWQGRVALRVKKSHETGSG